MKKDLIVVESPTKAKAIKRYVGDDYEVFASLGHIKDLPHERLGVDPAQNFRATYQIIKGKEKIVAKLKDLAGESRNVFLAPDPDREGEAIAWHVAEELSDRKRESIFRVTFHEVTRRAVLQALKKPGRLSRALFEAQQARRILDRLVGYKISPLLWRKVRKGLSAGRVQSVALRIISEREQEVRQFVPELYWNIYLLVTLPEVGEVKFRLEKIKGEKVTIKSLKQAKQTVKELESLPFVLTKCEIKEKPKHAPPPFITSTLQQEGGRKLSFSVKRTMTIAQQLYEGIELGEKGIQGLITYHRTDSVRVATQAIQAVRKFIRSQLGEDYLPSKPNSYRNRKLSQDAHEAIRPTSIGLDVEQVKPHLNKAQGDLYGLIWRRFVASQMKPALIEHCALEGQAGGHYEFVATLKSLKFPGYLELYKEEQSSYTPALPKLKPGVNLEVVKVEAEKLSTQPPARFTESTLVKELEKKGIGRPSTYAVIIETLLERNYVSHANSSLKATELGEEINKMLCANFPEVMDIKFTALMEEELDKIEDGEGNAGELLRNFYSLFQKRLEDAQEGMQFQRVKHPPTSIRCEKCGAEMIIKWGKKGRFLACPNFPNCRNTKEYIDMGEGKVKVAEEIETDLTCEKCGRNMVVKVSKKGRFLACPGFPQCHNSKPLYFGVQCPHCENPIIERRSRKGRPFFICTKYPKCNLLSWDPPIPKSCPRCHCNFTLLVEEIDRRVLKCYNVYCDFKEYLD